MSEVLNLLWILLTLARDYDTDCSNGRRVCWTFVQLDQNLCSLHVVWQQQLSINIWCPRLTSAANPLAAVDRQDRQMDTRLFYDAYHILCRLYKKGKGSPYSITDLRVPELILVLGSQLAGDRSRKLGGRLPLLSARPAVTPVTLKRAATSFAAWWTEARQMWTVCLRLLPDSVATAIWTWALLRLSRAR